MYYALQKDFRTPREAPSLSEKTFSSSKKKHRTSYFFLLEVTVTNSLVDSDPDPHRSVLIFDDWIRILQVVKNYPRKEIN